MTYTAEGLKGLEFRGPVRFSDGSAGWAQQDFECISEPRFSYAWQREDYKDRTGRQFYMVDGKEVKDLEEAAALLNAPADPESPTEVWKRHRDEFDRSPKVRYTRALSEARCNAEVGPFGQVRAFMERAGSAWHGGINQVSDNARKAGEEWPRWLYSMKSASYEMFRLMWLWEADRKRDTGLTCALGVRCRDCSILKTIEASMIAEREPRGILGPKEIFDKDIDAAKTLTCIGHALGTAPDLHWEGLLATDEDRKHVEAEGAMLASLYD